MKKYLVRLVLLSIVMVVASFVPLWTNPDVFLTIMPVLVLYFAVATGVLHYFVVVSAHKDPRTFIKNFLGGTVGCMLVHLCFVMLYAFTHVATAKYFLFAFLIGYAVYLVYETAELVYFVKSSQK